MAQTLCIKCGSELKASSYCQLCQQPLIFACTSCEYTTEEKVHTDCRNAEVLAKAAVAKEEETAAVTTTTTTTASESQDGKHQKETLVDKQKEEEEMAKASPDMTKNRDNDTINPFVAGTAIWQSLMNYWFNWYTESLRSTSKMNEEWYNRFWKSWLKRGDS
jgi:hypothetical protein